MSRCDVGVPPQNSRSLARAPPSLFSLFSCLYVVAALIIVEILLEFLEIVLTTITLEGTTAFGWPSPQEETPRGITVSYLLVFSVFPLSLFPALRISWQCVCTRPVHLYREYPYLHAPSVYSYRDYPFLLCTLSPFHPSRDYPSALALCTHFVSTPFSTFSLFVELLLSRS
jgi:hypothetical protein